MFGVFVCFVCFTFVFFLLLLCVESLILVCFTFVFCVLLLCVLCVCVFYFCVLCFTSVCRVINLGVFAAVLPDQKKSVGTREVRTAKATKGKTPE